MLSASTSSCAPGRNLSTRPLLLNEAVASLVLDEVA